MGVDFPLNVRKTARSADVCFAVIAMREVSFFSEVAECLGRSGISSTFVSFFSPGNDFLRSRGYDVFDLYSEATRWQQQSGSLSEQLLAAEERYGFKFRELCLHEQFTFNRFGEADFGRKVLSYLETLDRFLTSYKVGAVFQELGGFVAPISLYYVARDRRVEHFFIEPSLYTGRVFLTQNSIDVEIKDRDSLAPQVLDAVQEYVAGYKVNKTVAMPVKDRHHFRDATLGKVLNVENARKLARKLHHKYVARSHEEYDAIGNHVRRVWSMYWNRCRIAGLYSRHDALTEGGDYVYFPFHVPIDFALTVRARPFVDQLSTVRYIANSLPPGVRLLVKEHPAAIGAYSRREIKGLLRFDNTRLLHPEISSFDIIRGASAVVTINSKVGAESIVQGKDVFVLGRGFYRGQGLTHDVDSLTALGSKLHRFLTQGPRQALITRGRLERFLSATYAQSCPGELYLETPENVDAFATSILSAFPSGHAQSS